MPSWAQPFSCVGPSRLFGPRGGVRMWHCQSVSVVCVPSLSVVQPLDCWSDPMALVALTLWGSGASRRRQSLPDDLHGCQSCPGDSEQSDFSTFDPRPGMPHFSKFEALSTVSGHVQTLSGHSGPQGSNPTVFLVEWLCALPTEPLHDSRCRAARVCHEGGAGLVERSTRDRAA